MNWNNKTIFSHYIKKTDIDDKFYDKFWKFMIEKITTFFKKNFDEILLDERISPLIDENSKTYYFIDNNKTSYAVMTILWQDWNPIEYKTLKLDD